MGASPLGDLPRAWTDHKGAKAPQAAGVIHSDFEKGLIKAEVIGYDDLVDTGTIAEARSRGKARIQGKDYVMQDRDVVELRLDTELARRMWAIAAEPAHPRDWRRE